MFLEMMRAALCGFIECPYEDPTLVNVDMCGAGGNGSGKEFVLVETPADVMLSQKPDNFFSVFAFNGYEYLKSACL